jgi:hypothetical protein
MFFLHILTDAEPEARSSFSPPDPMSPVPFGSILPLVSFAGSVLGSGLTLLEPDAITGVDEVQRKCCGFVQLSTYIGTPKSHKTPGSRAHSFLVFVMFPIHEMPWPIRCKRMMDRTTSQFQPGTLFICGAGTIVGRLNHATLKTPPSDDRDYVFIVVPDDWSFQDRSVINSSTAPSASNTPMSTSVAPPVDDDRAFFKRSAATAGQPISPLKRSNPFDAEPPSTPSKKPQPRPALRDSISASSPSSTADTIMMPFSPQDLDDTRDSVESSEPSTVAEALLIESETRNNDKGKEAAPKSIPYTASNTLQKPKRTIHPTRKVLDSA